jgi:hypothetical protein
MCIDNEEEVDDELVTEDDILKVTEGTLNNWEMVYTDVALNIAEEFEFFNKEYIPVTVPDRPAILA